MGATGCSDDSNPGSSGGDGITHPPSTDWYMANTEADTFRIYTAGELAGLAQIVNSGENSFRYKTIILVNNLDLSGYGAHAEFNGGKGWIPIGNTDTPFRGNFQGNQKLIRWLYINDEEAEEAVGLFGDVVGGTVENLGVTGAAVRGKDYVGIISGSFANGSEVIRCYSTGKVEGVNYIGGIAGNVSGGGFNTGSKLEKCYSTAAVSGNICIGGVAGIIGGLLTRIQSCYSSGAISSRDYAGGVVGYIGSSGSTIMTCAALNPSITTKVVGPDAGRILGYGANLVSFLENKAFSGMTGSFGSITGSGKNGTSISKTEVSNGTNGGYFTASSGWTVQKGKLPGLFGKAVDMPAHLK
jgi:hypothetical protein